MLVGLPGAGKTTVGELLAGQLGWTFIDFDDVIQNETGLSVAEIFVQLGEAEFRRRETELTARLASEARLVLSPGGGWILRNSLPGAVTVWLQVETAEAIRRLGDWAMKRPLLRDDPRGTMSKLLQERELYYSRADIVIDTNGMTADEVVAAIIAEMNKRNGD